MAPPTPSASFSTLPTELVLNIVKHTESITDILTLYRVNRRFNYLVLPAIFERYITRAVNTWSENNIERALFEIFLWSIVHNQINLIRQLTTYTDLIDLKGLMMESYFVKNKKVTFLHFSLLMDAPNVAQHLMKYGADLMQEASEYPDLTCLALALGTHQVITQQELDAALRTSCSYALPRTTEFLLARGADSNAKSQSGQSPIHTTLAKKPRWGHFSELHGFLYRARPTSEHPRVWEQMIIDTAAVLQLYGADINCRTATSQSHQCDFKCWNSVSCCENGGQTPLHLAAANGFINAGRSVMLRTRYLAPVDDDGYTPLYYAIAHEQWDMTVYLLRKSKVNNPIVNEKYKSTLLHIACRFGMEALVFELLEVGAEVNAVDTCGRTPLHELLTQTLMERKSGVMRTLRTLSNFEADLNLRTAYAQTPKQMGERHEWATVRAMFTKFTWLDYLDPHTTDLPSAYGKPVAGVKAWNVESFPRAISKELGNLPRGYYRHANQEMSVQDAAMMTGYKKYKPRGKRNYQPDPKLIPNSTSGVQPATQETAATQRNHQLGNKPELKPLVSKKPAEERNAQAEQELPLKEKHRQHIFTIWEAERLEFDRKKAAASIGAALLPEPENTKPEQGVEGKVSSSQNVGQENIKLGRASEKEKQQASWSTSKATVPRQKVSENQQASWDTPRSTAPREASDKQQASWSILKAETTPEPRNDKPRQWH
ncbi:putative ankyrin 2,3/unc44 [Drepanopeziza brunnea f. sp. 'multigermtubi' MB_m1]|uniref:Putative ankyrin 2,3/unc44 n=1 Tax=Marssonina brunnea f. sp. multigermtubi (strain MB_m1) TaxID=1072389 RepID=K1WWJ2_MARBU|nr:putative ankyrin 2,3/unc44 [Drepanopeziza brunnea f. sp. 'multigermtubi' MB_m1]EKD17441.1 putative ankyrin 2,3/unc44 [Drepanopeziza brunnea f. sp. 'multigermtubi' MB_m1]